MIANFVLMGDLYQHEDYLTLATPWNAYPWQIGSDNRLMIAAGSDLSLSMSQMNWGIESTTENSVVTLAELSAFFMPSTLISIDGFGNIGSDAGNEPDVIPPDFITPGVVSVSVLSVSSESVLILADSNVENHSDQGFVSIQSSTIVAVTSQLTLIDADSFSEPAVKQGTVATTGASIISVTSNQV